MRRERENLRAAVPEQEHVFHQERFDLLLHQIGKGLIDLGTGADVENLHFHADGPSCYPQVRDHRIS